MLATVALLALAAVAPQDTVLDVPVFEDATYGVALPRPFDDWVFVPATGRGTTTVIFHPRDASLRDQLWGALVLTTFDRDVPLAQVADQRIATSWQPTLGPSFALLARDSVAVLGLPAIHVVMGGSIERAVLDVEEYLIARGGDLILVQFRYPRGLPRDSIAAGYQHVMDGLRILGGTAPRPPQRVAAQPPASVVRALSASPWHATAYDALVRVEGSSGRIAVVARLSVRNDAGLTRESLTLAVAPPGVLDSVAAGAMGAVRARGPVTRLRLPTPAAPQAELSLAVFYHLADTRPAAGGAVVLVDHPWLPLVEAPTDGTGQLRHVSLPRLTLRFELPDSLSSVAPGRLTTDVLASGRRRMTWTLDESSPWRVTFAIAPFTVQARRAARLTVRLWRVGGGGADPGLHADSLLAMLGRAWALYSRMFGPTDAAEISVVESDAPPATGGGGLILVGPGLAADRDVLLRDLARRWWGRAVLAEGPGAAALLEALPAWAALAARGVLEGDSVRHRLVREAEGAVRVAREQGRDRPLAALDPYAVTDRELMRAKGAAALEAARRAVGEARFREAVRTLATENRGGSFTVAGLSDLLGADGAEVLRSYLFGP